MLLLVFVLITDMALNRRPVHWFHIITRLAMAILLVGLLFKILHWPYAGQLLIISCSAIALCYIVATLLRPRIELEPRFRHYFIALFTITSLFAIMHWPADVLYPATGLALLLWLGLFILKMMGRVNKNKVE